MELLERSLQAVLTYLLRRRKDDIVRELGDNILSQMEDKAEELGRPLTEAEQGEVLKQHGHPVVAAARYGRLPLQYLIGPTLFPMYWYAVQLIIGFVAAFHLMVALVLLLSARNVFSILGETWASFWVWTATSVGAATICFGLIEYFGKGRLPFTETFEPRDLPKLRKPAGPGRANSVVELIFGTLFIIGWLIFLHGPTPSIAGLLPIHLAPVWYRFEIPMLLTVFLGMSAAFVHLFRPQFPALRAAVRLVSDVVGVITFYFFLGARQFVVFQADSPVMSHLVTLNRIVLTQGQLINYAAALVPAITLLAFFIDGIVEVTRLAGRYRTPAPLTQHSNGIL